MSRIFSPGQNGADYSDLESTARPPWRVSLKASLQPTVLCATLFSLGFHPVGKLMDLLITGFSNTNHKRTKFFLLALDESLSQYTTDLELVLYLSISITSAGYTLICSFLSVQNSLLIGLVVLCVVSF